ncbi:MFS transporter [Streptomyces mirabilis]|nr:MFS transporter [Streptomyces mirabilis]
MVGFGAASVGIGLAPDIGWVIGLRVAQGVFGALSQPATLGMLRAPTRPTGSACPSLCAPAPSVSRRPGSPLGGALVTQLGWRPVFFLNVVPALLMAALALTVRDAPGPEARRPDSTCPARRCSRWPWSPWCARSSCCRRPA